MTRSDSTSTGRPVSSNIFIGGPSQEAGDRSQETGANTQRAGEHRGLPFPILLLALVSYLPAPISLLLAPRSVRQRIQHDVGGEGVAGRRETVEELRILALPLHRVGNVR